MTDINNALRGILGKRHPSSKECDKVIDVGKEDGCPHCGERDADNLVWMDESSLKCSACGHVYRPDGEGEESPDGQNLVVWVALQSNAD